MTDAGFVGATFGRTKLHRAKLTGAKFSDKAGLLGDDPELAEAETWNGGRA